MVIAALAMTALLLFAALALDVGAVFSSRTQSQNADDSAALAAAAKMIVQEGTDPTTVDLAGAQTEGTLYADANATLGKAVTQDKSGNRFGGVAVVPSDFKFGTWNLQTRKLHIPGPTGGDPRLVQDNSVNLANPSAVTGVRVTVRMDDTDNKQSPAFLSQLIGIGGFQVKNTATGYLGFEGSFRPGEFKLPIGMDSCDLSTGGCGSDYCATIASPPHPCALRWIQGANPVTCLEFASTPEQNACWTVYDGSHPSVNNPDLQRIVDSGNPGNVQAGDRTYLDNGSKIDTLKYMRNKFYGCKNNGTDCGNGSWVGGSWVSAAGSPEPMGRDRYGTNPVGSPVTGPGIDSWVVKLPVFECQQSVHCAGGSPFKITGAVCFEIREILAPAGDYDDSSQLIKGRFLCPDSADANERALFDQYCRDHTGPQDPGGCGFGLRADRVVLVE